MVSILRLAMTDRIKPLDYVMFMRNGCEAIGRILTVSYHKDQYVITVRDSNKNKTLITRKRYELHKVDYELYKIASNVNLLSNTLIPNEC